MFLLFHASVFIFLNLFGNILKQSKLKLHCNFQQHPEGAPKAQKLSGTFEKRLENFLAVVEGQGARVGEVAVVCSPQSVLFPGRDLSLQEFLFSPVRIQLCAGTWEVRVFREWGWGKTRRCQRISLAHNLESERKGEGPPYFPRCQELSVVPRSGQVWWVDTLSLRVTGPEFLPGSGQPTPHSPLGL